MNLTFDQLPEAVYQLIQKVDSIDKRLAELSKPSTNEVNNPLTISEASAFIKLSIHTVYALVSKSEIPHMKKGKRLYFSKAELTQWLSEGKRITKSEADSQADFYLSSTIKKEAA